MIAPRWTIEKVNLSLNEVLILFEVVAAEASGFKGNPKRERGRYSTPSLTLRVT
jgi:hypothetical protein